MEKSLITGRQPLLLTSPVFISSLLLLIANDYLLKPAYPNWLTGKLSDFAGVVVLAYLLAYLVPKLGGWATLVSGAVFVWWKLPFSGPLITWGRATLNLPLHRVIDYTDLLALAVLPFTWLLIRRLMAQPRIQKWPAWSCNLLLFTGVLVCMATTMSPKQRAGYDGVVLIDKIYSLNVSKITALSRLNALGYNAEHAPYNAYADSSEYIIRNIVLNQTDTLKSIRFSLRERGKKSKLTIRTVQASHRLNMKNFFALRKRYTALIRAGIIAKVEN